MPISENQLRKLNSWLKSKNVSMICPSCGHNEWSAADVVVAPVFAAGMVIGGPTVPMVQLICKNCAYVKLYAAVPIGLLEPEAQKAPPAQQPEEEKHPL
jgi:predicted nucleic-acid-binding Zn-ribbon protein